MPRLLSSRPTIPLSLWLGSSLVIGACSPQIGPGAYLCGPEKLCPEGMTCNGPDNTCVFDSAAEAFSCPDDPAGDDEPATGTVISNLSCVSVPVEINGCLATNDSADWVQFDVPPLCTAVQIEARLSFPVAFEPLVLQWSSEGGPAAVAETPCGSSAESEMGESVRCFTMTVASPSLQALGVSHSGAEDCGGDCAFNRYLLQFMLSTP